MSCKWDASEKVSSTSKYKLCKWKSTVVTSSMSAVHSSGWDKVEEAVFSDVWRLVFALTWHVKNYTPGQEGNLISSALSE